jgi:hypothetical protein
LGERGKDAPKGSDNMARRSTILVVLAALFALGLMVAAPAAVAHHREKHDNGKASASGGGGSDHDGDADNGSTVTTEDNDADGVSNAGDTNESHHPSGKDRFLEKGGSGNQGKSESDPDDNVGPMRREEPPCDDDPRGADKCTDKPGGSGGHDTLDQDGNNGCGNDQDFDDDNNGWCGKPPPCCEEEGGNEVTERPEVLGALIHKRQPAAVAETRQARGGVLPFTGAGLAGFVVVALAMITSGGALLRMKRS